MEKLTHESDCASKNMPALPNEKCNCGAEEEFVKKAKVDSMCSYCKHNIAECASVPEFSGDEVIECNAFEIVSNDEMWFLKRCKSTLQLCFKSDTKVLINFKECTGNIELNSFTDMLEELFKNR